MRQKSILRMYLLINLDKVIHSLHCPSCLLSDQARGQIIFKLKYQQQQLRADPFFFTSVFILSTLTTDYLYLLNVPTISAGWVSGASFFPLMLSYLSVIFSHIISRPTIAMNRDPTRKQTPANNFQWNISSVVCLWNIFCVCWLHLFVCFANNEQWRVIHTERESLS